MKTAYGNSMNWMFLLFAVGVFFIPDAAFAGALVGGHGATSSVGDGLCIIAACFQGEIASGIATIAVCTIGALACVGRVQWTTAITVGTGIAVLFGAMVLVGQLSIGAGCSWNFAAN